MTDTLEQFKPEKIPQITADRSTLERCATCPHSHYLYRLIEAMQHEWNGTADEAELKLNEDAPRDTAIKIGAAVEKGGDLLELDGVLPVSGVIVHELIEEAFKFCEGDLDQIPDYFLEELPKVRPDLQPQVIRAG